MMKVFASYDLKAAAYGQPICAPTRGLAIRGFSDAVGNPRSEVCKYAEDYIMYEIGSYDPATGKLESLDKPVEVCRGGAIKAQLVEASNPKVDA